VVRRSSRPEPRCGDGAGAIRTKSAQRSKEHRSPPRDVRMSLEELAAIAGYASQALAETKDKGFGP
jgi:hypothetical protein